MKASMVKRKVGYCEIVKLMGDLYGGEGGWLGDV